MEDFIKTARELGEEAGRNAASWVLDGNAPVEHYRRLVRMMDEGDPALDDHLPAAPSLSGEWADGATPDTLYREVTGEEPRDDCEVLQDAICLAWQDASSEAFALECERLVRGALA